MQLPPIPTEPPDNIVEFTGKTRAPSDRQLVPVELGKCLHFNASFEIDVDGGKCRCKSCGGEVTPFFVLEQLMNAESRWMRTRAAYLDEMKRLAERSSTKCRHCGAMTRISRS